MEIEIQSKTNNPLFKRTEVHFIIHHDGEGVPKRDFIKSELAGKLNAKKENIMINYMKSSFGTAITKGYAKVYTSLKDAKAYEKNHILIRNKAVEKEKKTAKEEPKPSEEKPTKEPQKPTEDTGEKPGEEKKEEEKPVREEAPDKPIEEKPQKEHQKEKSDTKDSKPNPDKEKKEST
jgi:small subunit ribosomal protein S24e